MLKFVHVLGAILIGGGLIGVWVFDLCSRQVHQLPQFAEAIRNIAVFYDGVVVSGALLLLASGSWMIVQFFSGWDFVNFPWLAGMVALFTFEFVEGNIVTRFYFMRLRRLTQEALSSGTITPQLEKARAEHIPTFTHFLDLPMFFVMIALGTIRPTTWTLFFIGSMVAVIMATILTILVPCLYPWLIRLHLSEPRQFRF